MNLKILHTNDIHSRFENFAKAATKIRELKDSNTVVLDAGDFNDFMRLELQGTDGRAGVVLLENAGYDAIAVGNNETFQGIDILSSMASYGEIPFLTCNLCRYDYEPIEGIRKSVIINKSGVRVLVIGTSPVLHEFFELYNMRTVDYKKAIKKEMDRSVGMYDICLLLSHLGMREDIDIAQTVEGIDIIIGGHSHTLMNEPAVINNTIIHQSGSFGEYLGLLEVEYDGQIRSFRGENIKLEGTQEDTGIIDSIRVNREKAIDRLSIPLYTIDKNLWHDVMEENPITNLLADALRDVLKCDIGLINSGVLTGGIRKGPVSLKKLIEICPSPLNPTYMEIQGKHIRHALEESIYADICTRDGRGPGFRGRYLGRLHVSGAVIEHDGRHITNILINDETIQDEKWYTVATSDYLRRGTGYESLANNWNEKYNVEYLRVTLKDYLSRPDFVNRAFVDRWIVKGQWTE